MVLRSKHKTEEKERGPITNSKSRSKSSKHISTSESATSTSHSKNKLKPPKAGDALPGTIAKELKSHLVRPTLHRRTTENSSLNSIPTLVSPSSPSLNAKEPSSGRDNPTKAYHHNLQQSQNNLFVPTNRYNNDDDDSNSNVSSDPSTPPAALLPKCYAVNERSNVGAFSITKEKTFKSLGIDVMVDEMGMCHVTDVSKYGMFADDNRIR